MRKLIRIKEGEEIPENAKFIEAVTNKIPTHTSKEYVSTTYGFFSDTNRYNIYQHYRIEKYYVYEVDGDNTHTKEKT